MSNYTKITDFSIKDVNQDLIEGVDFDNEFTAVSTMSTTKADKAVPATPNSVAGLNSSGNLYDTTVLTSDLQDALNRTVETGALMPYGGDSAPSGYLLADGTEYLTSAYSALFGVIGYTFGGSGANFNVPDLRGRVAVGPDNMGGTDADVITNIAAESPGKTLGLEEVVLSPGQMPIHVHTGTTDQDGLHTHPGVSFDGNSAEQSGGGAARTSGSTTGSDGLHNHPFTTDPEGNDEPHLNVQPSLFINWIIKF